MEQSQISFKNSFYLSKKTIIGKNVVFRNEFKIFYNKSSNKTLYSKKIYLLVQIVFLSGIK